MGKLILGSYNLLLKTQVAGKAQATIAYNSAVKLAWAKTFWAILAFALLIMPARIFAQSTDATLSNLTISPGSLNESFASAITSYTANVGFAINSITVTPTANHPNTTITVAGNTVTSGSASASISLNVGSNPIDIIVTAQDGITKIQYSITVTRAAASTDATLSGLSLSAGTLSPPFASNTTSYSADVGFSTSSITITPITNDVNATVTVNGSPVISGSASGSIDLNVGANPITVLVTAQDGSTNPYTITVTRAPASSDNTLSSLVLSAGTLNPSFSSGVNSYTASVSNAVTSITVTPTVNDATATIKVNGTTVASGSASGAIGLNVGANTITVLVTAQDGSTNPYTISVTRAQSSDATLSSLVLSAGTLNPSFSSGVNSYTASVSNAITSITVTPTVNDATATVQVNGTTVASGSASSSIPLLVGPNTITVLVAAQDGSTNPYTISVTRAQSSDATLSSLVLSAGTLNPSFSSGVNNYTASVGNAITSITVTPTINDATATVQVNGTTVGSGSASSSIPLLVGPNTVTVLVTAQDGSTNTYTITVTRAQSSDATLSSLVLSAGTLNPSFSSGVNNYTASVGNAITSITVTPTVNDATATIKVNGTTVASGSASGAIGLNVGANTITVLVTAQDGSTNTYTITVTRAQSSDATLSSLVLSTGTLVPPFTSGTITYTASVGNGTTSIKVTPTTTDATSTVAVNGTAVTSGSASTSIPLAVGLNTITVVVTAQDGITKTTYTIDVTRAPSSVSTLSNLTINIGTLVPTFASGTLAYAVSVSNGTTNIKVTPTTTAATSTVTVNGTIVASGNASGAIPLTVGPNTITVIVTAQDGTTKTVYTIDVTRAPSSVATLSNLVISAGTLAPSFTSGTMAYAASVGNGTTSITVTPTTTDQTSTVTVNNTTVASGNASGPITLNVGINTILVVVTAQDGTTTDSYSISVSRAPSSIVTLNNLTISSGTLTPAFSRSTLSYVASVTNATASITVTPTTTVPTESVTVNGTPVASGSVSGPLPLSVGPNTINVLVTAQDGSTTTYSITVTRAASTNAALSNLAISAGTLVPIFASGTTSYTISVGNAVSNITVTPTAADVTATIKVNGTAVASGTASNTINLNVGTNTITTVVTAQDGATTDTYTIVVTRAPSSVASLSNLTLSTGALAPVFSSSTLSYVAAVSNATTSITVTPTVTDPNATITVNGAAVASGSASGSIPLAIGSNTLTVVVTAQNGTTNTTYTVVVTRTASSVATLSNLTISSGSFSPNFNSLVTSYAVSVANTVGSVTVTPTTTDRNATITVNGTAVASGSASGSLPLQVGSNIVNVIVTAQDGTTVTYTITVSRTPATSVVLANLTISSGSLAPDFSSTVFGYASAVANATTSLTVTATTSDPTNTITVNGVQTGSATPSAPIPLVIGANVITVVVSAPGGVSATYTITVARAGAIIATLSNLTLSQGTLKPAFSSGTRTYTATVDYSISSITVTPTTTDANATIKVNSVLALSGQPSQIINLDPGDNAITVDVLAQDGITSVTYTIAVTRNVPQNDVTANNLLSPNGDGKNDTWYIKNIDLFPNNTVTVFDHSGKVLYTKRGYNNDWDGNYNGQPLKEDTYYYVIDLGPGDRKIKGYITVLKRR